MKLSKLSNDCKAAEGSMFINEVLSAKITFYLFTQGCEWSFSRCSFSVIQFYVLSETYELYCLDFIFLRLAILHSFLTNGKTKPKTDWSHYQLLSLYPKHIPLCHTPTFDLKMNKKHQLPTRLQQVTCLCIIATWPLFILSHISCPAAVNTYTAQSIKKSCQKCTSLLPVRVMFVKKKRKYSAKMFFTGNYRHFSFY